MTTRILHALLVAVVCFTLSGCRRGCAKHREKMAVEVAEKLAETSAKASGEDVDLNTEDGKFEIKTEQGKMSFLAGEDLEIPDDFPEAMIVYDGAKLMHFMNSERGTSATFSSDDERTKIVSSIKEKMEGDDWKTQTSATMGNMNIDSYIKDGVTLSITVAEAQGKRTISQALARR